MFGRRELFFSITLLLVCSNALPAQDMAGERLSPTDRVYGLSLIWKEADYNFPRLADLPALDWDSAYQAYVPRVRETGTTVAWHEFVGVGIQPDVFVEPTVADLMAGRDGMLERALTVLKGTAR